MKQVCSGHSLYSTNYIAETSDLIVWWYGDLSIALVISLFFSSSTNQWRQGAWHCSRCTSLLGYSFDFIIFSLKLWQDNILSTSSKMPTVENTFLYFFLLKITKTTSAKCIKLNTEANIKALFKALRWATFTLTDILNCS